MSERPEKYNLNTLEGQQHFLLSNGRKELGKYGLVAFASRAALRVMPLLGVRGDFRYWPENEISVYLHAIDRCLYWSFQYSIGWTLIVSNDSTILNTAYEASNAAAANSSDAVYAASAAADAYSNVSTLSFHDNSASVVFTININYLGNSDYTERGDVKDFILQNQRQDILWLQKNNSGLGENHEFADRELWIGNNKPKDWGYVESNFRSALQEIGMTDIWENYQSNGLRYLKKESEPIYISEKPEQKGRGDPGIEPEDVEKGEGNFDNPPPKLFYKGTITPASNRDQTNPVLGVDEQAEIMGDVLENMKDNKGQFVGLFGRWGRGKTFFWEQLWKHFMTKEKENPFIKVEFHAWKYQDTPASWAYLYQTLSDAYLGIPIRFWLYYPRLWALNIYRGAWKKPIWGLALGVAGAIVYHFSQGGGEVWESVIGAASPAVLVIIYQTIRKEFSTRAREIFQQTTRKVSFEGHLGAQAEIQAEIVKLLKVWIWIANRDKNSNKKILLFIDDIDRCEELKLIAIVDSIRVMLENDDICKRMIVLVAVDERILKLAIANKYRKMEHDNNSSLLATLSREYMDKLFIAGIKLNRLPDDKLKEVMDAITKVKGDDSLVNPDALTDDTKSDVKNGPSTKPGEPTVSLGGVEIPAAGKEINVQGTQTKESEDDFKNLPVHEKENQAKGTKSKYLLEKVEYEVFARYLPEFLEATPRTNVIKLSHNILYFSNLPCG